VIVCLRVLARTWRRVAGARALAFLPPQVQLPCRYFASSGCAPKSVGTRKSPSYLAQRLAAAGLQLAAAMTTRIRIIRRNTRVSSPQHRPCDEPLLHIAPHGPWQFASVRNAANFFWCVSWACALRAGGDASLFFSEPTEAEERYSCLDLTNWLFWNIMAHPLFGEEDSTSPPR
jgi:hypothetical protein